jgi:phosphoglycolate phosphatase
MIENIFFDLGGTLINPMEGIIICIKYALKQLGYTIHSIPKPTELAGKQSLHEIFQNLLSADSDDTIQKALSLYHDRYFEEGIFETELYPEISDLLERLKYNNFNLFIATKMPVIYTEKIIQRLQLNNLFDGIAGLEPESNVDGKTELAKSLIKNHNLKVAETVMIGDSTEDIIAGKTNGIKTIGVTYGFSSKEKLLACAPDHICDSPDEIFDIVTNA